MKRVAWVLTVILGITSGCLAAKSDLDKKQRLVMEDGGWCWYQDPRAIIANGKLIVGGINGQSGDVKVGIYDLKQDRAMGTVILHKGKGDDPQEGFEPDDHNAPALYMRPDGSILAVYSRHAKDRFHYYRISDPQNYTEWGEEQTFKHVFEKKVNNPWGVTYMNLYYMQDEGLLYNFFRDGMNINPSFITSSDQGKTWGNRTHFITDELGWQRPYARYLQVDANTVGVSFTDAHPRKYGNSLYYAEFRNGAFYKANGEKIKDLSDGPIKPSEAERIYTGSNTKTKPEGHESVPNSAWTCSMASDKDGHPHLGYTLYLKNDDHRYRMAHWNGERWTDREVAYAGGCLYTGESSYTGLMTMDPLDPTKVAISTDVDPKSGKDKNGQHEIYVATISAKDSIHSIHWKPVTKDSDVRNIRPIIVAGDGYKVLVWLRGKYHTYTDYDCDVVGLVLERP